MSHNATPVQRTEFGICRKPQTELQRNRKAKFDKLSNANAFLISEKRLSGCLLNSVWLSKLAKFLIENFKLINQTGAFELHSPAPAANLIGATNTMRERARRTLQKARFCDFKESKSI